MGKEDHGLKRLVFLGIAVGVVIVLARLFESGEDNPLIYLLGVVFVAAAVFGFFRPDLVDFDGN